MNEYTIASGTHKAPQAHDKVVIKSQGPVQILGAVHHVEGFDCDKCEWVITLVWGNPSSLYNGIKIRAQDNATTRWVVT